VENPAPSAAAPQPAALAPITAAEKTAQPAAAESVATSAVATPSPVSAPTLSANLIPAVPISQVNPKYPQLALRTKTSAKVVLDLQINDQGKVVKATPVSGPVMFHDAAVSAAMQWRYKPASIDGKNMPSQSRVTMTFKLQK